jgi:hypothetical protein
MVPGDRTYVKGGTDYNENVTIADGGKGSGWLTGEYCLMEGYTTTPGDQGRFAMKPTSGNAWAMTTSGSLHWVWANMDITLVNSGQSPWNDNAANDGVFVNCHFNDYHAFTVNDDWLCINCIFENATFDGFQGDLNLCFYGCIFRNCGRWGVLADEGRLHRCIGHSCTQAIIQVNDNSYVTNCVWDNTGVTAYPSAYLGVHEVIADNVFIGGQYALQSAGLKVIATLNVGNYFNDGDTALRSGGFASDDDFLFGANSPFNFDDNVLNLVDRAGGDYRPDVGSPLLTSGGKPGLKDYNIP